MFVVAISLFVLGTAIQARGAADFDWGRMKSFVNLSSAIRPSTKSMFDPAAVGGVHAKSAKFPQFNASGLEKPFKMNTIYFVADVREPVKHKMFVHDPKVCMYISRSLLTMGHWEPKLVKGVLDVMKNMPTEYFLDIGGNLGAFSLAVAAAGYKAIAFEPLLFNAELFAASVGTFPRPGSVTILKTAVSNVSSSEQLCVVPAMGRNRQANQGNGQLSSGMDCKNQEMVHEFVPIATVDKAIEAEFGATGVCVAAMKIDVEGMESKAFMGASKLMGGNCPPCHIQLEYINFYVSRSGVPPESLFEQLEGKYGYNCTRNNVRKIGRHAVVVVRQPGSPHLDGDWTCRMQDFQRHPRCEAVLRQR